MDGSYHKRPNDVGSVEDCDIGCQLLCAKNSTRVLMLNVVVGSNCRLSLRYLSSLSRTTTFLRFCGVLYIVCSSLLLARILVLQRRRRRRQVLASFHTNASRRPQGTTDPSSSRSIVSSSSKIRCEFHALFVSNRVINRYRITPFAFIQTSNHFLRQEHKQSGLVETQNDTGSQCNAGTQNGDGKNIGGRSRLP